MKSKDLLKLAGYLRKEVPKRAFFMLKWGQIGVVGEKTFMDICAARRNKFSCGMAACLGGHASVIFPRRLRLVFRDRYDTMGRLEGLGKAAGSIGRDAFASAFDLCEKHADDLTTGDATHQTPKAAATAIERLVRNYPKCRTGIDCH